MEIEYRNKKVKKQCTELKQAQRDFGPKIARKLLKLLKLLNFIECAESLSSVINNRIYNFHALKGDRNGEYALDVDGRRSPYRLIVTFESSGINDVFSNSIIIQSIEIEEVSKHYE